jgi:hypothetical protein
MPSFAPALCRLLVSAAVFVALSVGLRAQTERPPQGGPRPQHFPWNCDLLIFESKDGKTFDPGKVFVERGGVPCVVRDKKDRLLAVFQWFPFERQEAFDRVAVVISEDDGKTWTKPEPISVSGLPEGAQRPFDPTLVSLEDGRLRLYFTCTTPQRRMQGIYSAISEDGVKYQFEPGLRFGPEDEKVIDPSVLRFGNAWHLYSPKDGPEPNGYHAVSDDGLSFRRLEDVNVPVRGSWIGNLSSDRDQLFFYGSGARRGWLARSSDGAKWELLTNALGVGGDPAPIKLKDGTYRVIATGPPRTNAEKPPFLRQPRQPRQPEGDRAPKLDLRRVQ